MQKNNLIINYPEKVELDKHKTVLQKILLKIDKENNIDILEGSFCEYIHKTDKLIGQAATSLVESSISNTPFYVYEPTYIGMSDKDIQRSIFKNTFYARSSNQLYSNLLKNNITQISKNKPVDGLHMTDILN